jgi:hypothetical protein
MTRRGVVLPIALAIVVVLALSVLAVFVMRKASYKSLDYIDSYLGAVSVGEAAHTDVVSRLESASWEQRFFKDGPKTGDKAWGPGTYEYIVADADAPLQADLIVFAKVKNVDVSMYWRLRAEPQSLLPYRRIRTMVFANLPDGTRPTPGALTGTLPGIRDALVQRGRNLPWVEDKQGELTRDSAPGPVGTALGIPPIGAVDKTIPAPDGTSPPLAVQPRVDESSRAEPPDLPALPRPSGGALPANPGTMQDLASMQRTLSEALGGAQKALRAYDMFVGAALGNAITALQADCTAGNLTACACATNASAVMASAAPVRAAIEDCISRIKAMQAQIDSAAAVPGPSQDRAEQLLADAQRVADCTEPLCGDIKTVIEAANAAVAPCQGNVATVKSDATPAGTMTTCGMY